ncbi:MAG: hypothetical protein Q7U75_18680, partial [Desulfobacterales bacterium]|nr:hypothetical protein [Desulfobacterales bacterium]
MALNIPAIIREARRNRRLAATYGSLVGGGIVMVFLFIFLLGQFGVFSGGTEQEQATVQPGQSFKLYGGALVVTVHGVEKRPLATFGADSGGQNLVALQVDMEVEFFPEFWPEDKPGSIGDILAPGPNMGIRGTIRRTGSATSWGELVETTEKDARYALLSSPLPAAGARLRGSVLFRVPVDAGQLSVVFDDSTD